MADRRLPGLILLALAVGCEYPSQPLGDPLEQPQLLISDGAHQGNPHFYFLPPLVADPAFIGEFDDLATPTVEICKWTNDTCESVIATYTWTSGPGSETIRRTDDQYVVNWHTDQFNLDLESPYRIRVRLEGIDIGFVDVALGSSGKDLKNIRTGDLVALLNGRTLPIKFRIEKGATDVVLSPGTVIIDETHLRLISVPEEHVSGVYRFQVLGQIPNLQVGGVIVGSEAGGFLRRITSLSGDGDILTIATTSATLEEALIRGAFEGSIPLSLSGVGTASGSVQQASPLGPATVSWLASGVQMSSTGYLLNGTTLFDGENCSGTVGETCATISLTIPSGHIEFDPTIDIGASIQNSTVTEFHLLADGMISVAADFHLVATDEFNLMGEVELGSVSKSFGFLVGSFPVWGKAELALVATFEAGASIAGSVTGGFEGAGTLRVGARYRSGVWNEEFEPSAAFAAHPVTWDEDLEAHARVGLRIVVSLELYGVGGPFLSGEPHLSASGAIDGAQCQLDIRVFAGVTGEIGLEFVDFIKKILGQIEPFAKDVEGPSATLFEESRPLHQGCDSGEDFVVTTVSAGTIHSCALTTDGTAYCWGRNVEGQLGDGSNNSSNIPVAVAGGLRFASISAGWLHSCGVTTDGNAYCWGGNAWGQLGDNTGTFSFPNVPVAVAGNRSFASVSAANTHTCGLATGGTAFCWGQGWGGEPVPVAGGFASLSAGTQHTCGVTPSGEAACWGSNNWGQLGSPTPVPDINALVYPDSAHNRFGEVVWLKGTFVSISAGADHTCGVTSVLLLPSTYCWGRNWEGQLGLEQFYATSKIPKEAQAPLTLPLGFVVLSSVDVGWNHSCAVAAITFRAYCWGENAWGQLGIGSLAYKAIPAEVEGNIDFASISAGASHTCGVTSNGHAYCWGSNGVPGSGGQLGDGTFESSLVPKQVAHP